MKNNSLKIFAFVLATAFVLALTSCTVKSNETTVAEKQIWLPYSMTDYSGNSTYFYDYNAFGSLIKMTKKDADGKISATWLLEYDENQNLIKQSVDNGDKAPFVQLIQVFDAKGNLTLQHKYTSNGETVYTYQYDDQGRLVSKSSGEQIIETYTYAADGSYRVQNVNNENEYRLYNQDGKITEQQTGTATVSKWVYSYNAEGILVEATSYSGNEISKRQVYQLDEHGNAVRITQLSSSGEETVLSEYEYKQYTVKVK